MLSQACSKDLLTDKIPLWKEQHWFLHMLLLILIGKPLSNLFAILFWWNSILSCCGFWVSFMRQDVERSMGMSFGNQYKNNMFEQLEVISNWGMQTFIAEINKLKIIAIPNSIATTLIDLHKHIFPNIHHLLILLAVLPMTTCEAEHHFSSLHQLKTYLRSTMGEIDL